jgi:hypothetical protein
MSEQGTMMKDRITIKGWLADDSLDHRSHQHHDLVAGFGKICGAQQAVMSSAGHYHVETFGWHGCPCTGGKS